VVVLPSLHQPSNGTLAPKAELLGLTLLEAMASGTPVVCTRVGGMPEVVADGETGYVVDAADPSALAERVSELVGVPLHWKTMSEAARSTACEHFTWSAVARRCLTR